ncbi:MAG: hypothetical protein ABI720_04770 [Actinomycetes bacterium]
MPRVLLFIALLGIVIYFTVRMIQRRRGGEGGTGRSFGRRPLAPDDDPTFLRDLDSQLWEQQRREQSDDPPAS